MPTYADRLPQQPQDEGQLDSEDRMQPCPVNHEAEHGDARSVVLQIRHCTQHEALCVRLSLCRQQGAIEDEGETGTHPAPASSETT